MNVTFSKFVGEAGDLQEMIKGISDKGQEETILIRRTGPIYLFRLRRAKRIILRRFEKRTGQKHIEKV